ncbi:unnamed protein product [Gongylonema pulchrum]|uniref:SSD domain-containing protein n=1 Tax=Gongylonema pulchrum TaxID=637853 RepID=A0A183DK04_9BILA|nr:unnamed protein product [Gongylonema pulchrum]
MSFFCLCTSLACLLDYIFTFTLFAPVLYITEKTEDGYIVAKKISKNEEDHKPCIESYARLICSSRGRAIALALLVVLYLSSAVGVWKMKSTFEPAKAFPSDSPLASSFNAVRQMLSNNLNLKKKNV